MVGGDGGIRTLDRALQPYNGLANRRLQPLGHVSNQADMPDAGATRKRQIPASATSWNRLKISASVGPAGCHSGANPRPGSALQRRNAPASALLAHLRPFAQ